MKKKNKSKQTFKVGDVVILNSGGPNMVVKALKGYHAVCQWNNREAFPLQYTFPVECLKPLPRDRIPDGDDDAEEEDTGEEYHGYNPEKMLRAIDRARRVGSEDVKGIVKPWSKLHGYEREKWLGIAACILDEFG